MPEFKFALCDRVIIKTADLGKVEGVVSGAKAMVNVGNEYDVHYLLPDLKLAHIVVPEDALGEMQPPIMIPVEHASHLAQEAEAAARRESSDEIANLRTQVFKQGLNIRNLRKSVLAGRNRKSVRKASHSRKRR